MSTSRTKETPEQTQFREFLAQVFIIFQRYIPYPFLPCIFAASYLIKSHDSNPSVLYFVLPTVQQQETAETSNGKRSKTDPLSEERTLASKLQNIEYTNISQIEVLFPIPPMSHGRELISCRMIYLWLHREFSRHYLSTHNHTQQSPDSTLSLKISFSTILHQ
jgi:hypothetical protein